MMGADEKTIERDGVTFYAVTAEPTRVCSDCVFKDEPNSYCERLRCMSTERQDKKGVIFVPYEQYIAHRMRGTA